MPADEVRANHDGLLHLSATLRDGTDQLATTAPATDAPDAGRSSANVGAALAAIVRSVALLMAQSIDAARKIDANNGAYCGVDNETATELNELEGRLLEPN